MYTMGRPLRRLKANQDPVATVAALVVVVAAESTLETLENPMERAGKFHYPMMSVRDVERADTRKGNLARQWKHFVEAVEQRGTTRKCV